MPVISCWLLHGRNSSPTWMWWACLWPAHWPQAPMMRIPTSTCVLSSSRKSNSGSSNTVGRYLIQRMVRASEHLEFDVTDEDLDFSISKALAATHEIFRRTRRGELVFAQTLLDELRFHIIQADDWLFGRTPRTQLFTKFDHRGSPEVIQCLRTSFCGCDTGALDAALASLCRLYRRQIEQLHTKFELARPLESDLIAIDLVLGESSRRNSV